MTDNLIKYDTALLAKEIGFNIYQSNQYSKNVNSTTIYNYNEYQCKLFKDVYYAPTQSLLQKFIREKYNIHIEIIGFVGVYPADISYSYRLRDLTEYDSFLFLPENEDNYDTYEECLEMGLYKSLTLIKERNEE